MLPEALTKPIETLEDAKKWIKALIAADMTFHFEDDTRDIGNMVNGVWVNLWTPEEAEIINQQRIRMYDVFGEECPIGYLLDLENPLWRIDDDHVSSTSAPHVTTHTYETYTDRGRFKLYKSTGEFIGIFPSAQAAERHASFLLCEEPKDA